MPFKGVKENALSLLGGGLRGKIAVDSSLKLALIQFGVLREKGRTIFWKSVQKGCPVPTGVPSSALPVSDASSQERGLAVPLRGVSKRAQQGQSAGCSGQDLFTSNHESMQLL